MVYTYLDNFLIDPLIGTDKLENFEQESITEAEKLGITDEYWKKQLVIYGTYKRIAANLLEANGDGVKDKLEYYTKEWDRVWNMAKGANGTKKSVFSASYNRA